MLLLTSLLGTGYPKCTTIPIQNQCAPPFSIKGITTILCYGACARSYFLLRCIVLSVHCMRHKFSCHQLSQRHCCSWLLCSYVIHTLDELVADDYMIVYFHGATPRRQMPNFGWLKKCYQSIDRK